MELLLWLLLLMTSELIFRKVGPKSLICRECFDFSLKARSNKWLKTYTKSHRILSNLDTVVPF
jgi:hypothetical protein